MTSKHHVTEYENYSHDSFKQAVLKYQDRLLTLCRHLLKNPQDAEDAAQETFIKAYKKLSDYTPGSSFYSWLSRIAVNTCIDHQRRDAIRAFFFLSTDPDQLDTHASHTPDPEASYAASEELRTLQAVLRQLSVKLRTVIVLKELEGLSYEEIADLLELSVGTVKSRISRAREEIIRRMKKTAEQNRI